MNIVKALEILKEAIRDNYLECCANIKYGEAEGVNMAYEKGHRDGLEWALTWVEAILRTEGKK